MLTEFIETGNQENPLRLSLNSILAVLTDEQRIIDWDDAWDTLDYLDSSYHRGLPDLWKIATSADANYTAKTYVIKAITLIDVGLTQSALAISEILKDADPQLRCEAAEALTTCNQAVVPVVVPALVVAAKDWRSTINAQAAAFQA